jgi:integrase
MEHMIRRGARYYYRRRVPKSLVEALGGQTEITRALNTSDPSEARIRARRVGVEIDDLFARAATQPANGNTSTAQRYDPAKDPASWASFAYEELTSPEEHEFEPYTDEEKLLALVRSEVSAIIERASVGRYSDASAQPAPNTGTPPAPTKSGPTLVEALAAWQRRRSPTMASVNMMERVIELARRSGMPLMLASVTKQHVTAFLDSLNEHSRSTQRSYLSLLKALFTVCVSDDMLATNPASSVKIDAAKQRGPKARVPFSVADLNVIVSSLRRDDPKASNYWLPLVAMFTGMRMMEIGQLQANDIKTEHYTDAKGKRHSVTVIYATDEGEEQSLKTQSSKRRIPVHAELVRLGFVKFARSVSGDARLFPELTMNKYGRITARYSHAFGKHLRTVCKITDVRKTFHSFRHGFKNALREGGIVVDVSDALTGHSTGSVAQSYGDDFWPLRPLVEAIERVQYHGLELPA